MELRPDFTKMSVEELRNLLVEKSGMTYEQACEVKPKSAVVDKLMPYYPEEGERVGLSIDNNVFAQAELETVEPASYAQQELGSEDPIPLRGSPEWQEYVLSLLRSDEYNEKDGKRFPKAAGLRRMVELLLGPIVESGPVVIQSPNMAHNGFNATVVYKISVAWQRNGGDVRVFSDVADAGYENVASEYAKHASATASSRAAGRAFRNALLLSVNTAEEMSQVLEAVGPTDDIRMLEDAGPITAIQIVGIQRMSDRLKISVVKLLAHNGYPEGKTLSELTKSEAQNIMSQLNKFSSTGKDGLEIPSTILV